MTAESVLNGLLDRTLYPNETRKATQSKIKKVKKNHKKTRIPQQETNKKVVKNRNLTTLEKRDEQDNNDEIDEITKDYLLKKQKGNSASGTKKSSDKKPDNSSKGLTPGLAPIDYEESDSDED